jgi:hypothetical protein
MRGVQVAQVSVPLLEAEAHRRATERSVLID